MQSAVPSSLMSSRKRGWMLFLIVFGLFIVNLDGTIVNVALPDIQSEFGVGLRSLQWVSDAYLLAFGCLQLAAGTIGDRLGYRRLFIGGLLGFTVFSAICALSENIGWLLAGRALQGAFGAVLIPVSLAMIRILYSEPAKRAQAIGIWAGAGGIALAAGPVLGGWLVEAYGWESIFWINVPVGIVISGILVATKSSEPERQSRKLDVIGQLSFIAFISLLAYGLIEGNARGWDSAAIVLTFAASGLALIVFIFWELRTAEPMFPLRLFRNPIISAAVLVNFLSFFGLYAVIFLLTLYWQKASGYSPIETGVRFLSLTASIMIFSYLGSSWANKLAPRFTIPIGSLIIALSLGGLIFLNTEDPYFICACELALLGFGVSIVGTSATVAVMGTIEPERAGAASGIVSASRQVSAVFGIALAGALLAGHISDSAPKAVAKIQASESVKAQLLSRWEAGLLDDSAIRAAPQADQAILARASVTLFEEGMHRTAAVSAIASAAGGAAILWLFRRGGKRDKAKIPNLAPSNRAGSPTLD